MVHPRIVTYVRGTKVVDDVGLSDSHATTDSSARAADHEPGRLAVLVRFSTAANSRFRVPYGWYTDRRGVSWRITS